MKKIILSLFLPCVLSVSQLFGQVVDSVSLSKSYANQSFYSLSNGEVATSENNTWDLAFGTGATGSTIRTNGATGVRLYVSPTAGTAHWETLDTTNFASWKIAYDSDTTWSLGAFSDGNDDNFNLGWGTYSMITHQVVGSKLFVIKLANGTFKKIWIEKLASGAYEFRHADLDGKNEVKSSVAKASYTTKNFVYYSIAENKIIDREPASTTWDLVFTNYLGEIAPATFYNVTGVLANSTVKTSKAEKVNLATATYNEEAFSSKINTIGYDWKKFDNATFQYKLQDSLAYFVKDQNNDIWKLIFTKFAGSSTGKIFFTKQKLVPSNLIEPTSLVKNWSIYPNPTQSDNITIALVSEEESTFEVSIIDVNGQIVHTEQMAVNSGLTTQLLHTPALAKGIYFIQLVNHHTVLRDKIQID